MNLLCGSAVELCSSGSNSRAAFICRSVSCKVCTAGRQRRLPFYISQCLPALPAHGPFIPQPQKTLEHPRVRSSQVVICYIFAHLFSVLPHSVCIIMHDQPHQLFKLSQHPHTHFPKEMRVVLFFAYSLCLFSISFPAILVFLVCSSASFSPY